MSIKQVRRQMRWAAVLLFLLAFWLMVSSAVQKSATVDEQSHLFRGVAYLKTGATHFLLGHPILGSALSALPILTEPSLALPVDDPAWDAGDWSVAGDRFLWVLNDNPERIIFLGRLPVMWLTLLLGALVLRWAGELKGTAVGLMGGVLLLMDPNILAHGRFITGDLPLALFYTLAVYGFWRWYRQTEGGASGVYGAVVASIGLGLAAATKFNAGLLAPTLGLLALVIAVRRRSIRPLIVAILIGLGAWVVIWVIYGFALTPLPGGAFWDDLFWELEYFGRPHGAYLAGQQSPDGWWYYFPITFLIKTPLPILIGLLLALFLAVKGVRQGLLGRYGLLLAFLGLPPLIYFGVSLSSSLNIGYRYLTPVLPFLAVGIALAVGGLKSRWRWLLPLWLVGVSLLSWPDYVPYFNWLVGGSNNGWRILSDSNVDWGQDLPALADWQKETGRPLYLSYFGTAHPSAFGVDFEPLPTWAPGPEQALPGRQAFYPPDPAPGWYAISVTNLHGVVLGQGGQDTFAWFRERAPDGRIGNSILLYEVPAWGEKIGVAFSALEPRDLPAEAFELFGTNDIRPLWFDAPNSIIVPGEGGWLVAAQENRIDRELLQLVEGLYIVETETAVFYEVERLNITIFEWQQQDFGGLVQLLGYDLGIGEDEIRLSTAWEVLAETERPLKLFVHALDENGEIASQWDGLDVDPAFWQAGDKFVQVHRLPIPAVDGWQLVVGLYDGATLERFGEGVMVGG